ncbi:MAG: hypothetical protein PF488_01120 [Patescibacteria group bacterium]|jgi:hypothetical protein|nr:hypothetical protein [Patescibacteria group bacterium]
MKKKIFYLTLSLFVVFAVFAVIKNGQTKNKPYYAGEAIAHNGTIYVGSTNSGYLEIFKSDGKEGLENIAQIKNYSGLFNSYKDFYDLEFNIENNRLYVYTISEYSIFKYEIKSHGLELVLEDKNTYWEWYSRIDKFGSYIGTVSAKGVKLWNTDLMVVNSYDITNEKSPYSLRADNDNYILNVKGNYLEIFDTNLRAVTTKIPLNFKVTPNNHKAYQDKDENIYVVDDYFTKKYNLEGELLASFRHLDHEGFDATGSGINGHFYFSNGMGVVSLSKEDLSVVDYRYTYNLAGPGGWAMGLEVVNNNGKEFVVVFNNKNVLLLDSSFNKIGDIQSNVKEDPYPKENLFLNLSHNRAKNKADITISGGGYLPNEELKINFAGDKFTTKSNDMGRFETDIKVPQYKYGVVDIKVDGQSSKLTYSTSFEIVK